MMIMASCNSLSALFLVPCHLKARTKPGKMSTHKTYACGENPQKWSILKKHPTLDKFSRDCEQEIGNVKKLLIFKGKDDPMQSLVMVDAIQRLGISSYFHEEIGTIMRQQYVETTPAVYGSYSLHHFSLFFRLLRQHGHYISADVFNNFKGKDGQFRSILRQDMRGLMELYEATQLSFHGEYILDEAAAFSSKILHGCFTNNYSTLMWATLCNAFLVEAKWFASGDLPTAKKYLENGKVSSGIHVAMVHMFFLLGLGEANGGSIHLNDTSKLMSSVAAILRLWDDLGSAKDEHQDGKDGSYIECYRKDNLGLLLAQAREHVVDMIADEWKNLNKECFRLNQPEASSFKMASMVPLMYSYDDNQRLPVLEEYVKFMLFNETS